MSLLKRMSCAVAVMQIASAASAQKQLPATPSEIVGGVKSCLSATTEKAVEADTLERFPADLSRRGIPMAELI